MKKAIAKCTQQDAPELQLPIYRNPYRVVNGLLNGAQEHERYVVSLLETIANNMNNGNNMNNRMNTMHNNMNTMSNGNYNNQGFNSQYMNNNNMVPLSQEYVQKLATEVMKQMQTQNQYNTRSNNVMGKLFNRQNSFVDVVRNQNFGNNFDNNMRFKRQADAGVTNVLDLGDRLRDKIVEAEKHAEQKIGNMTCVMKEMNIINDNHEIDIA